jgi:hypothetical protein
MHVQKEKSKRHNKRGAGGGGAPAPRPRAGMRSPAATGQDRNNLNCYLLLVPPDHVHEGLSAGWRPELV